jgi:hypothetical protein
MRLLRLADVEIGPNDRSFCHSRARAAFIAATALVAIIALLAYAFATGWKPAWYFAAVIVLLSALMSRFVTACFRPSNWLVQINDGGLFIHFRSYLNYHLPAEDPTVVFVTWMEIRSARLIRERMKVFSEEGGMATQTRCYVELELGAPGLLGQALQAEFVAKCPQEKRWYGRTSTLYQDYPVRMPSPPFLQLQWSVVPSAQSFLEALRPRTVIEEPVRIRQDFTILRCLSQEEQHKRLRELVHKGETIVAIYTARQLYGCGLNEAKNIVDQVRSRTGTGVSS